MSDQWESLGNCSADAAEGRSGGALLWAVVSSSSCRAACTPESQDSAPKTHLFLFLRLFCCMRCSREVWGFPSDRKRHLGAGWCWGAGSPSLEAPRRDRLSLPTPMARGRTPGKCPKRKQRTAILKLEERQEEKL